MRAVNHFLPPWCSTLPVTARNLPQPLRSRLRIACRSERTASTAAAPMGSTEQVGQYPQSQVEAGFINFAFGQPTPGNLSLDDFRGAFCHRFAVSDGPSDAASSDWAATPQSHSSGGGNVQDPLLLTYGAQPGYQDF